MAGHKPGEVAKQLNVRRTTVDKWVRRFSAEGPAGLLDRSSRPHRSPRQVPAELADRIVVAREVERVGARELSTLLGVPASTTGAVLRRAGVPHLAHLDRVTGEPVRGRRHSGIRYEHDTPARCCTSTSRSWGESRPAAAGGCTAAARRSWAGTCAAFLHRACQWFHHQHGVTVRRVLTDNAKSYRIGADWAAVCAALQIRRRFTKPGCPWTNRKAERLNRTLQARWPTAGPGPATTTGPRH